MGLYVLFPPRRLLKSGNVRHSGIAIHHHVNMRFYPRFISVFGFSQYNARCLLGGNIHLVLNASASHYDIAFSLISVRLQNNFHILLKQKIRRTRALRSPVASRNAYRQIQIFFHKIIKRGSENFCRAFSVRNVFLRQVADFFAKSRGAPAFSSEPQSLSLLNFSLVPADLIISMSFGLFFAAMSE